MENLFAIVMNSGRPTVIVYSKIKGSRFSSFCWLSINQSEIFKVA